MLRLKARVGPKGQVVIPKPVRDELGIRPGDEICFSMHGGLVQVEKGSAAEALHAFFAGLPERKPGRHLLATDIKRIREEQYEAEFRKDRA